jgi:hypothetical protein
MKTKMSLKKRLWIAIPTVVIIVSFLFLSWYYLPKTIFTIVLICFLIITFSFDFFAKKYEEIKKGDNQDQ